jgi:hypothetical protein
MENPNVGNVRKVTDRVAYSFMNNLKRYDRNSTGRNIESLEGEIYQAVREFIEVTADSVPGLRSMLEVAHEAWDWSMQIAEFVNRNKLALCIRKFAEKKFWVWVETDKI